MERYLHLDLSGFLISLFIILALRYEGTVWDDLAQGKGVYIAENGLVRCDDISISIVLPFVFRSIVSVLR